MKSFKTLLSEAKRVVPIQLKFDFGDEKPKTGSQLNKEHGEMYELLTAAHIKRHLAGHPELQDHHYAQNADQENTFSRSEALKQKHPRKWQEIHDHSKSDAESFVSHLRSQGYGNMLDHPDTKIVHTPRKGSISTVVTGTKKPMSSSADIVLTNPTLNQHVGVDTKYGGSVTLKANPRKSMMGILKRGYSKTGKADHVNRLYDSLESGQVTGDDRSRVMKEIADHHARAFNAMNRAERNSATSKLSNAGTDSEMRTFQMKRNYRSKGPAKIEEPAESFAKRSQGLSEYRAAVSGRGFHIYGVRSDQPEASVRVGMKQTGGSRGKSAANVIGNVKKTVRVPKDVKTEYSGVKKTREKFKQKVEKLRSRSTPTKLPKAKFKVRRIINGQTE
jgi:hypothetical protein